MWAFCSWSSLPICFNFCVCVCVLETDLQPISVDAYHFVNVSVTSLQMVKKRDILYERKIFMWEMEI